MKYLFAALLLAGCNLNEALDNSSAEPEPKPKDCAFGPVELADTANFRDCYGEPRPTTP